MKTLESIVLAVLLCLVYAGTAAAQTTATQQVTIVVEEVSALSVSGDASVTVDGVAADGTIEGSDNTTTYNVTTNASSTAPRKITGQLTSGDFSAGLALFVDLTAPSGATAAGEQQLANASAVDLVTGISGTRASALTISYRATAAETVTPNPSGETQTVTYTITN